MYVSTSSKISNHLDKVEGILEEDSRTSFYSKSRDSYKKVFLKLLKMIDFLIGVFPEFSKYLQEYKFENIPINTFETSAHKVNSEVPVKPSSNKSLNIKTEHKTTECSHTCFFQSMCKFYQSASDPGSTLDSESFSDISNTLSLKKAVKKKPRKKSLKGSDLSTSSNFHADSSNTCNSSAKVDVSPVKQKSNYVNEKHKSKYSLTSDLAIALDNGKIDADFEELIVKSAYRQSPENFSFDISESVNKKPSELTYKFTSEDSRDLYNTFNSLYDQKKTKDNALASKWLNTLYIEKAKPVTSQRYFSPSGVPGKIISFILADEYYCDCKNDTKRVWNELTQWCDRYNLKYPWSAPKCTSASTLKKLNITSNVIASAYTRWLNLCYDFNIQNIMTKSMLRLYPSQFIKKIRSLKILTDKELYDIFNVSYC